jgi:hypothetical protein
MKLGDAFTMAVPPRYDTPHLFFVISDPSKRGGAFFAVNITTNYIRAGKECILTSSDHDWITKTSYVSFRDILPIGPSQLDPLLGTLVKMQKPLRDEVLRKIIQAAKNSRSIANEVKALL